MNYSKMYAERVLKMAHPKDEIAWLFTRLSREDQEELVEIFELDLDNE